MFLFSTFHRYLRLTSGMLAEASLKIKIPVLPPPAKPVAKMCSNKPLASCADDGEAGTSADPKEKRGKSKRKMRPPKSQTG